jgi:hypothetical protein
MVLVAPATVTSTIRVFAAESPRLDMAIAEVNEDVAAYMQEIRPRLLSDGDYVARLNANNLTIASNGRVWAVGMTVVASLWADNN